MRFKNQPTCQNRAKDFRCVSVWMWMLQAWSGEEEEEGERGWVGGRGGGSPSLSSHARVNFPRGP